MSEPYTLSNLMKILKKSMGLRERIAQAETEEALDVLVEHTKTFTDASAHTQRRWANTAKARRAQLRATDKKDATKLAHVAATQAAGYASAVPHKRVGVRGLMMVAAVLAMPMAGCPGMSAASMLDQVRAGK